MPLLRYLDHRPSVDRGVWIADDAYVVGKVTLAAPALLESSAVIRGDQSFVEVGAGLHMGAHSTIHVETDGPTRIGRHVWLGPGAVVHACTLGDGVRIEAGALVLSDSVIGAGSLVAAGALVTEGAAFDENSYLEGSPARRLRDTTAEERAETLRRLSP